MRAFVKVISLLGITCVLGWTPMPAKNTKEATATKDKSPIIVVVRGTQKGLLFEVDLDGYQYKKVDANYCLAELKMKQGNDRPLLALVEDRAPLSAITEISEMAINAGFTDIRPYIYWPKTGNMARIEYGKPIKFTKNPEKIERREEQR